MLPYLEVWKPDGSELVPLEGEAVTIGVTPANDLSLDFDKTVSRLHAVLQRFSSGWTIRDLGSRNGTLLNGRPLRDERALRPGDELLIGETRLVYKTKEVEGGRTETQTLDPPPPLEQRERTVLDALAAPLVDGDMFTSPATSEEIAQATGLGSGEVASALGALFDAFELPPGDRSPARLVTVALRRGAVGLGNEVVAAAPVSSFRREGEFWTIGHGGEVSRLKDSKGMRYLAILLANPGREHHALELVAAVEGTADGRRGREDGLEPGAEDAGPVLDAEAKAAYKQRLADLQAEIDEAEGFGDPERLARAKEEMEFVTAELAGAVGLGGRDRMAVSAQERARVAVTKAIRSALERIREHSPALGRYLIATIKTGTFCSYAPPPGTPPDWRL